MARPGKLLRGSLILFGVLFVPFATVLLLRGHWGQSVVLFAIAGLFVRTGTTKNADSWMALIDELDE